MEDELRTLGEFGFIAELRERFAGGDGVRVGLGDDAAVVDLGGETVFTTDMLVEGVHFDAAWSGARDVGFKAIACSASDVAAMGCRPAFAVVALGMPAEPALSPLEIADGVAEAASAFGCAIVGGDTTSAPRMVLSVAMLGTPGRAGVTLRSTARVGDLLCVTGEVGAASAALALHRDGGSGARRVLDEHPTLNEAMRRGRARVREAPLAAGLATAMIDVSDGVGADALHLAEESGIGVRVQAENAPAAPGVAHAASMLGTPIETFTISGGDDYELLIAVSPHDVGDLREALAPTRLTVIGEFTDDSAQRVAVMPGGERVELAGLGWDHFRGRR